MEADDKKPYSELRQQKRIDLAEAVPLRGPLTVYLEPTNICNFKCSFCPESFANYKEAAGGLFQLDLQRFEAIAPQIKAFGTVITLNFYMMGEPFANKNLLKFVEHARRQDIANRIILTSNGTLIKPERHAEIVSCGLDYLRISIYGGTEAAHRKRTGSNIPLSRIKKNVAGLKAFRDALGGRKTPYLYVKMIESADPQENASFLREFDGVGDEICIEPVMNWNDPDEGNLAGIQKNDLLATKFYSAKKRACSFPFYTLVVHSDLNVSVCCVDWNKKTVVGSLRSSTLQQIWHGDALRNFQLKHLEHRRHTIEGCRNCCYLHTAPDNIDALTPEAFLSRLATQAPKPSGSDDCNASQEPGARPAEDPRTHSALESC